MSEFDYHHSQAYFRDDFVPFSEANLSIGSSPVLYGLCVYTVFAASWDPKAKQLYAFRLKDHYKRLVNSANIMDFNSFSKVWSYERFELTMLELLRRNKVQENVLVRAAVFVDELLAGTKIHDLKNSFSAYVYPMGHILPDDGAHVCVSSWQRTADNAIPSRAKVNGSYINASLMKNEALLNGYDEAIAIDDHGHVAEGTVANLFIVRGGKLITPDPATDILEGITRDTVLQLAAELGIPAVERSIDRSELYIADEIMMCGSSARVLPILSVDKRQAGNGQAGPLTKKIATAFQVAQTQDSHGWLTKV
ncbi:MAG: aminotransferase class IV [Candidatus Saccharimonadales bacterium]